MVLVKILSDAEATLVSSHSDRDRQEISNFIKFLKKALEYRESEIGVKRWEERLKVRSEMDALDARIGNMPYGNDRRLLQTEYDRLIGVGYTLRYKEQDIGKSAYTAINPRVW